MLNAERTLRVKRFIKGSTTAIKMSTEFSHLNNLQKILYNNFAYSRQYKKFRKHTVSFIQFSLYIGASSCVFSTIGVYNATIAKLLAELATYGFSMDIQKETVSVYFEQDLSKINKNSYKQSKIIAKIVCIGKNIRKEGERKP